MVTGHGRLVSRFPIFNAITLQFEVYQTLSINTIKQTATKKKTRQHPVHGSKQNDGRSVYPTFKSQAADIGLS